MKEILLTELDAFSSSFQEVPFSWKYKKWDEKSIFASVGSCFASEIVSVLSGAGIRIGENPNGILYNPHSIAECLHRTVAKEYYREDEFFFRNGLWHSFSHHGSFSGPDRDKALQNANQALENFYKTLEECDGVFLTLSSSVVYEEKKTGKIAANCHKEPQEDFIRRLLTHEECTANCRSMVESIRKCNKECIILFSLSPVRHYPGDPVLNSVSKGRILSSMQEVLTQENVEYFPAYELLHDSLRDYRYYGEDLLHPSPLAVKIVLEKFLKNCFVPSVGEKVRLWRKMCAQKKHIPGNIYREGKEAK